MSVATAADIRAISCPIRRAKRLSTIARLKYMLPPDLAHLRRLALAECRFVLGMTGTEIVEKTGTPRSQVYNLTRGLRPTATERISEPSDTCNDQHEHPSDRSPDTMTTLTQLMSPERWNALATMGRRQGQPTNCGILIATGSISMADLRSMDEDAGLLTFHQAGSGSDKAPPRWLTSPAQTEARLTPLGVRVATDVVAIAGVLLYLSPLTRPTKISLVKVISGIDEDRLNAMFDHSLVKPVTETGETALRDDSQGFLRITPRGRRYTTVDQA